MPSNNSVDGVMYMTLAIYLRELRIIEARRPKNQRRSVPTMKRLAEVSGIDSSSLSRIANGHTKSLSFDVGASIVSEMRRRGFNTQVGDILKFKMSNNFEFTESPKDDSWTPPPPPLTRRQRRKYPGDEFVKAYAESESAAEEEAG